MGLTILVVGENSKAKSMANRLAQAKNGFSEIEICKPADVIKRMHAAPKPEMVLLEDCSLPRNTSLQCLITCMAKLAKETRVLVLGAGELKCIIAAVKAGAHGYIHNNASKDEFKQLLCKAMEDNEFVFLDSLESITNRKSAVYLTTPIDARAEAKPPLTMREQEVIQLIAQGMTTREISNSLFLSMDTINWYVKRILSKLGLRNRMQLSRWERENSLDVFPDTIAVVC